MVEFKIDEVSLLETATTTTTTTTTKSNIKLECRVGSETFAFLQDKCLRCLPVNLELLGLGKCRVTTVAHGGFSPTGEITLEPIKEI